MENKPRVTIIMPNYNNGPYLRKCLDSVLNQTFSDFILLIIDDGSTDDSISIIKEYDDPRFVLYQKEKNSGIVDSLNIGIEKLETEYFVRLDGDDYMRKDRIECLVEFMDNNSDFGICGSDMKVFDQDDYSMAYGRNWKENKAHLVFCHNIAHPSIIFRSSIFENKEIRYRSNFYLMEDYDLLYRLRDVTKYTSLEEQLYYYRQTARNEPEAIVQRKKETYLAFYVRILEDLGCYYPEAEKVHFELYKNVSVSFPFKQYKEHCQRILTANKEKSIYPHKELEEIVQTTLNQLKYRMMDKAKLSFLDASGNRATFKYYIQSKFKKS